MLVFALILLAIAAGCGWAQRQAKAKVGEVLYIRTSSIAEIAERAGAVAEALGQGHSRDYTEVKGEMDSPELLQSPLAQANCVFFETRVEREWEAQERYRDSEGKQRTRRVTGRDPLFQAREGVSFYVQDGSGRLRVDPTHSEIDLEPAISRFVPGHAASYQRGTLTAEGLSLALSLPHLHSGRQLVGYHFTENIFAPTGAVYLLGSVVDQHGELTLVHPEEKSQRYLITHKSEEELVSHLDGQVRLYGWICVLSGAGGVAMGLAGLLTGNTGF